MFYTGLRGEQLAMPDTRLTSKDKLDTKAAKPMTPSTDQKPADIGLFDVEGRKQQDLPL